ncbi:uncharacterized protein LOC124945432 [Impatiens glandulifera]|uniref:uncharacterized protein LOC124945432 n=1 Tax=Impatiens glandulifera TaxID=253017 RepID=UPI001FB09D12|nr:uncharacterized protein LOC124945432 [Impatiens glandulifera]
MGKCKKPKISSFKDQPEVPQNRRPVEMYYNKTEALKEKEAAEKMICSHDYINARERLLHAQKLFPGLDQINSMLTVCDVLSASENKIPGYDIDYYWILRLMPSSSSEDIKFRYDKLNSQLFPIKNKFPGTELAIKYIQDAFLVLSDAKRRLEFNFKREASWAGLELCDQQASSSRNQLSGGKHAKIALQDVVIPLNLELVHTGGVEEVTVKKNLQQDFYDFENDRRIELFATGQIWATRYNNNQYAKISMVSKSSIHVAWLKPIPVTNDERRWCDAGLPVACGSFCLDPETTGDICDSKTFLCKCLWEQGPTEEQFEIYPKKGEIWAIYERWDLNEWSYNPEAIKSCKFKFVEILYDYSRYLGVDVACLSKVDGFMSVFERISDGDSHISPSEQYLFSHKIPAFRFKGGEICGVVDGMIQLELENAAEPESVVEQLTIPVPNLNGQRSADSRSSQKSLVKGEVWAIYQGKDSMPRRYVRINTNSNSGNQVDVTFLEHEAILDHEMTWNEESVPIACGMYSASGNNKTLKISRFSHLVRCQFSTIKSVYRIYPMKGEIWGMYKNWKQNWNLQDYKNCRYEIVEILSSLSEGSGIMVAKLAEVKGCLTFFQRVKNNGYDLTRVVTKAEIHSFSHRIPSFRVPGIQLYGIPESSYHLEPNALPHNKEVLLT